MTDKLMIEVTPNLLECVKIFKEAAAALPEGELKTRVQGAAEYLEATFEGRPQPEGGRACPRPSHLVP